MSKTSEESRIINPEIKLEDLRARWDSNTSYGRGRRTAAPRGYNAELLAHFVLDNSDLPSRASSDSWVDIRAQMLGDQPWYEVEAKSCVDRYQKQNGEQGRYGMFKIWKSHHDRLLECVDSGFKIPLYFFVVYTVSDRVEQEVGKLIVPIELIDSVLDNWTTEEHVTMGEQKSREISWRLLLKRLDVSRNRFEDADIIDLTNE